MKEKEKWHFESQTIADNKDKKLVLFLEESNERIGIQENIPKQEQTLIWLTKKEFDLIVRFVEENNLVAKD